MSIRVELIQEFYDLVYNDKEEMLYRCILKKLKESNIFIYKYKWFDDKAEFLDELFSLAEDVLQDYDPERGKLLPFLISIFPNKIISKYGKHYYQDISQYENTLYSEIGFNISVEYSEWVNFYFERMPDFNKTHKLVLIDFFRNKKSLKLISSETGIDLANVYRIVRDSLDKMINLQDPLDFYLCLMVSDEQLPFELEKLTKGLTELQSELLYHLYKYGRSITEIADIYDVDAAVISRRRQAVKKKIEKNNTETINFIKEYQNLLRKFKPFKCIEVNTLTT